MIKPRTIRYARGEIVPILILLIIVISSPLVAINNYNKRTVGEIFKAVQEYSSESEHKLSNELITIYNAASQFGYNQITIVLARPIAQINPFYVCPINKHVSQLQLINNNIYIILTSYTNIAKKLNKEYGIKMIIINYESKSIKELTSKIITKNPMAVTLACGLINDFNELIFSARQVIVNPNNYTYSLFYRNLIKISIDLLILESDTTLKTAYNVVGYQLTEKQLFDLILDIGGSKSLKIAASLIYWELKDKIQEIIEQAKQYEEVIEDIINLAQKYQTPNNP